MSKISLNKIERIKEEILRTLYESYPEFKYTYQISDAVIRDDEFVLNLLKELKKLDLVTILEESKGNNIKRKWSLTSLTYEKYKELLNV